MTEIDKKARIAGALYLLLAVVAPLRLMYIPSTLIAPGDPATTLANVAAHEGLFRLGILSDLATGVVVIFVALALFRLFEGVDRALARLMVILGALMVTPIYFLNTLNDAAVLMLATGGDMFAAFDAAQRAALAGLFLGLHRYGVHANEVFWSLWLVPMALLTWRSGFLPRFLSVLLLANAAAYIAVCVTGIMWPARASGLSDLLFPALMAEPIFILWLLVMGAKPRGAPAAA